MQFRYSYQPFKWLPLPFNRRLNRIVLKCLTHFDKSVMGSEGTAGKSWFKGQVTIPKAMRDALKLEAGSKVCFVLEGDKLVVRRWFDALAVFRRVANAGTSIDLIDLDKAA